jgi:UDP-N-acetylglucosamine transferase subunit ALG13
MRLGLSLIVVPNATLLDNHQDELAEELENQGYVTKSDTKSVTFYVVFKMSHFELSLVWSFCADQPQRFG